MLKKIIFALVIALNILLCNVIEDFIQSDTNVMDLIMVVTIVKNINIPKIIIQVCREIDHHKSVVDILFLDCNLYITSILP